MATFREMIYMCLDLLKESVGDSYYTEEHVLFLLKKARTALIEKKYKATRNSPFAQVSEENKQRVCFNVSPASDLTGGCDGNWLQSSITLPELMDIANATTCTYSDMLQSVVSFIPRERIPYTGYNKWLKNIIYAARSIDGRVYLHSSNPQFMYLTKVGITGVFSDPEEAFRANSCGCGSGECGDIMDEKFPIEESLVTACVDFVVQELSGSKFIPRDNKNDSSDTMNVQPQSRSQRNDTQQQNTSDQ